ncbi:MAG: hypothetical protein AAF432_14280 [Planctomycetota bacterium]
MSVVVAVRKNGKTVLAADSLTTFGDSEMTPGINARSAKISRIGNAVVGSTGWGVYDDILAHYLRDRDAPDLSTAQSIFAFFLEFWKALHDAYPFVNDQAGGKDTPFGDLDSTFLVGSALGIFKVSSDLGVTPFERYYAVGSGSEYALGALYESYDGLGESDLIARGAVSAACAFDVHCGGDIDVLSVT